MEHYIDRDHRVIEANGKYTAEYRRRKGLFSREWVPFTCKFDEFDAAVRFIEKIKAASKAMFFFPEFGADLYRSAYGLQVADNSTDVAPESPDHGDCRRKVRTYTFPGGVSVDEYETDCKRSSELHPIYFYITAESFTDRYHGIIRNAAGHDEVTLIVECPDGNLWTFNVSCPAELDETWDYIREFTYRTE